MITQIPAFNQDYFKIGEAIEIYDVISSKIYDALVQDISKDTLIVVRIEWYSPMSGSAGYEARKEFIRINDVVNEKIKIIKYRKE